MEYPCCPPRICIDNHPSHEFCYSLLAEAVYLKRVKLENKCLAEVAPEIILLPDGGIIPLTVVQCNEPEGTCLLDTDDLMDKMGYVPGMRLTLSVTQGLEHTVDARYLGVLFWKGEDSAKCPGGVSFPFKSQSDSQGSDILIDVDDWVGADKAKGIYRSHLLSADLNYWNHVTPKKINYFSFAWTVGLRYLQVNEKFKLNFQKGSSASDWKITTENVMFGFQTGLEFDVNPTCNFTWGLQWRLGALGNNAQQSTLMKDFDNTEIIRDFQPCGLHYTFLVELAPFISFTFGNHGILRFSYELLYLSDLALAPNQLGFSQSTPFLSHHGEALYHGGFLGLGFIF
ncbi:MAG: hypothetical protein Tsb0015_11870 [Simkaniaceae bacterium]